MQWPRASPRTLTSGSCESWEAALRTCSCAHTTSRYTGRASSSGIVDSVGHVSLLAAACTGMMWAISDIYPARQGAHGQECSHTKLNSTAAVQVWAYPTTAMQCDWLGERVATVDATRAIKNVIEGKEDAGWGPNAVFRQAASCCLSVMPGLPALSKTLLLNDGCPAWGSGCGEQDNPSFLLCQVPPGGRHWRDLEGSCAPTATREAGIQQLHSLSTY